MPTVLRLSDEAETAVNLADPERGRSAAARAAAWPSPATRARPSDVAARRAACTAAAASAGGEPLGHRARARRGGTGRYRAPYLRDPLLDAGALVETLETGDVLVEPRRRSRPPSPTRSPTRSPRRARPPVVLCHISHVYETGASLYFTVLCAQADDPLAQWREREGRGERRDPRRRRDDHATTTASAPTTATTYQQEIGPLALDDAARGQGRRSTRPASSTPACWSAEVRGLHRTGQSDLRRRPGRRRCGRRWPRASARPAPTSGSS